MDDAESAFGVGGRIPRARREPTIQLGQGRTREPALLFVVPGVANVLVDDAVGVEVRRVADPAVPTTIVPSESCREMRRHVCAHCTGFLGGFTGLPGGRGSGEDRQGAGSVSRPDVTAMLAVLRGNHINAFGSHDGCV